jgi:hypothetical protein
MQVLSEIKLWEVMTKNQGIPEDLFNKRKDAQKFREHLINLGTGVIGLSGKYGIGKTTLIKYVIDEITGPEIDIMSLYFDAWKYDFVKDPVIHFMKKLVAGTIDFSSEDKEAAEKKVKDIFKKIFGVLRPIAGLVPGLDKSVEIVESALNVVEDTVDRSIHEFKIEFASYIEEELDGKLILFIDELDRCKPTYALQILEIVKHIFDINGLIVVLVADQDQLLSIIEHEYGKNIDASGYLRKIYTYVIDFPSPSPHEYLLHLLGKEYLDSLDQWSSTYERDPKSELLLGLSIGIKTLHIRNQKPLSLRDAEKIVNHVKKALGGKEDVLWCLYIGFLSVLRIMDINEYQKYINGEQIDFVEIENRFSELGSEDVNIFSVQLAVPHAIGRLYSVLLSRDDAFELQKAFQESKNDGQISNEKLNLLAGISSVIERLNYNPLHSYTTRWTDKFRQSFHDRIAGL